MRAAAPLLLLFVLLAPASAAQAALHSALPPPNARVEAAAARYVELRFTEDVERHPVFTTVDVVGVADQESRLAGPLQHDADERHIVRAPLAAPLPDGLYVVTWRTLSPDAQTARGSYLFAIGNASVKLPAPPEPRDPKETPPALVLRESFARAVTILGVAFAVGVPLVALAQSASARARALRVAAAFAALGALATLLSWLFLAQRLHAPLASASATLAGRLVLARALALALAAAALALASWRRAAALLPFALLAGGAALAATVMGGRGAWLAEARALSVAADAALLVGAALAVGAAFARPLGIAAPRPAFLAAGLGLAALGAAFVAVRDAAPAMEPFMLALGAFAFALASAFAFGLRGARPAFAAGAIVMLVASAGVLAAAPPPDRPVVGAADSGAGPALFEFADQTNTTHVVLDVAPRPLVANGAHQRVDVALHPLTASGIPEGTNVTLTLVDPSGASRVVPLVAPRGSGEWSTGDGTFFTAPGSWRLDLTLDRPDEDAAAVATLRFRVDVGPPAQETIS